MPSKLEIRAAAVEVTIAEWKDRPFQLGKYDCWKLTNSMLKKMGVNIPNTNKGQGYKSPVAGRAELRRVYKVKSLPELMDKFFQRIIPAQALPGDIMAIPGVDETAIGALGFYIGNDLIFGYVDEHDTPQSGRLTYEEGAEPLAAWRTLP